jgi:DnaK suppressor protein
MSRDMRGQSPVPDRNVGAGVPADAPADGTQAGERKGSGMKQEIFLPNDYRPAEDEPFMNERQLEYFRRKLMRIKAELLDETRSTLEGLQDGSRNIPDAADRASEETDRALELRIRDRQRKLVSKVDSALRRIENGEYGYCSETGEPISLKRLDARPTTMLSLEAQERHERREKVHRDD